MSEFLFQIQPRYAERDKLCEFALQENLFFEPIEMYMAPAMIDVSLCSELKNWHKSLGRTRAIHGAFIDVNPVSASAAVREYSRACCEDSCLFAKELGAEQVVFHSSCAPFLRGAYIDTWANAAAGYFSALAEKHHIAICLENSMDIDPDPLEAVMKKVTDDRVKVCLDIGHVNYSNAPMEEWFDRLGGYIGYLHLSDNHGQYDDHLPLGDGSVNWEKADKLWRSLNRDVPITLEVGGIEGVKKSLNYLKRHGWFCGGKDAE